MTDTATSTDTTSSSTDDTGSSTDLGTQGDTSTADAGGDAKAEVAKWKDLARKHEARAKANAKAEAELEELKKKSMTDQEKAVAEAMAAGRAEIMAAMGGKLAAAEIRARAAGRLDDDQIASLLEAVNLAAFLDDTGEVDAAKVAKFVDGIAPKPDENDEPPTRRFPDLGQGARGGTGGGNPNMPLNGDPILRDVKAKLGIR